MIIKEKRGITLIALVITIIVMLILVAVTINIAVNGGLFDYAGKAVKETEAAKEEEHNLGDLASDLTTNELIKIFTSQEIHNWEKNGDILTCTCKECKKINVQGRTLNIGQELSYTTSGVGISIITAEKSGLTQKAIDMEDNSIAVNQTISKDANTKWVVLGREDKDNNGTYESLLLTTETPTTDKITLYGAAGYNYWPEEADRIAKELYGNNARCMTIDDINAALNYTPSIVPHSLSDDERWSAIKARGTKTPDQNDNDTEEDLGKYIVNGYTYSINNDITGANAAKALLLNCDSRRQELLLVNI